MTFQECSYKKGLAINSLEEKENMSGWWKILVWYPHSPFSSADLHSMLSERMPLPLQCNPASPWSSYRCSTSASGIKLAPQSLWGPGWPRVEGLLKAAVTSLLNPHGHYLRRALRDQTGIWCYLCKHAGMSKTLCKFAQNTVKNCLIFLFFF